MINNNVEIGKNCNISQGVTIGSTNRGEKKGVPMIGNNVYRAHRSLRRNEDYVRVYVYSASIDYNSDNFDKLAKSKTNEELEGIFNASMIMKTMDSIIDKTSNNIEENFNNEFISVSTVRSKIYVLKKAIEKTEDEQEEFKLLKELKKNIQLIELLENMDKDIEI